MTVAEETVNLINQLPPDKARSVLDFARFLAEKSVGDQEWEKGLETAHTLPKFQAFIENAEREIAAGKSTPMDMDKL